MSKITIITGKGGVGKSSVAAAHAVKSAKEGIKTLLVSTDMAHNIADIFETAVGGHITPLMENLYGLELDPDLMMKEEFPDLNQSIANMFSESGLAADKMGQDFIFPGFDDLFCLLKIVKIQESGEYGRIIVDCAPTGETLSLLKLPELLSWYMEKFFPVGKTMVRILSPISKYKYHVNLPSKEGMNDIEQFHQKMIHLQEVLKDDQICSVRLVCTPEKMVVEETKRNYMYLNLYGYRVDWVFANRILPENLQNEFFEQWKFIQGKYIEEIEAVFRDLPITKIPWFQEEVRGKEAVENLVNNVFVGEKLFDTEEHVDKEIYEEVDGGYRLGIRIPGLNLDEIKVACRGSDLDINLHNFQRRIPLPNVLRNSEIADLMVEDGILRIVLKTKEENKPCES